MIAIQVKRCAVCGALEDVHTISAADSSMTIELTCRCGKGEARTVKLAKGESYWLEIPVVQHTHEAAKEAEQDELTGQSDL